MRLRTILIAIAAVVVLAVAGLAAVLYTTDVSQYRGVLAEQVKAATGRELQIGGELHLQLSLNPTIAIHDVAFANAEWGSRPQMATFRLLEAQVDVLALLSKEVKVDRIVLIGADILLETNKQGQANWAFGAPSSGAPLLPTVADVAIEDSSVAYRDGATGKTRSVSFRRLSASADSASSPIKLSFDGAVNGSPVTLAGSVGAAQLFLQDRPFPIELTGNGGGATLSVIGKIDQPLQGKGIDLAITADGKSLADLGAPAGLVLPRLGPYDISLRFGSPEGSMKLSKLQAKIGESDISGDVSLDLAGPRPRIVATLVSSKLDLRDLGVQPSAPGKTGAAPSGAGDGRVFPADPFPLSSLKTIDATIKFTGRQVIKRPVSIDNLSIEANLAAGKLTISRLDAGLSGGTVTLSGTVDAGQPTPAIATKAKVRGVEAGALLRTLAISDVLTGGKVNLDVDVRGRGESMRALMAGLSGTTSLDMGSGHIDNGFARILFADLFRLVATAGGGESSSLNCLAGRLDIDKGVATSRAMVIDTPGATIVGSGTVRLDTERLDMRFDPNAKQASLANFATAMLVGGTLADPSVSPDPLSVAKGAATAGAIVATGGLYAVIVGLTANNVIAGSDANPCVTALAASAKTGAQKAATKPTSVGGQILKGADDAAQGVGNAVQGVGDTIKGLFQ